MTGSIRVNTREFSATLQKYLQVTGKDLAEIVNTKAFFVARGAVRNTRKADLAAMQAAIGPNGEEVIGHRVRIFKRKGVVRGKEITRTTFATLGKAPRLALIINARRGKAGLPGLTGGEMHAAMEHEWKKRKSAINFLRAGWLAAVAVFARAIGKPAGGHSAAMVERFGVHGGARVALPGFLVTAELFTTAFAERHPGQGLKLAAEGLQSAVNHETASMRAYIERKMQERINRLNRRVFR